MDVAGVGVGSKKCISMRERPWTDERRHKNFDSLIIFFSRSFIHPSLVFECRRMTIFRSMWVFEYV